MEAEMVQQGVRRRRRRGVALRRWVVPTVVLGFLVAGCGSGNGEDAPTEPPTEVTTTAPTSTEPTEEPTEAPEARPEPTRPPAMDRDDIEGATAAAVYFMDLYGYIFATGDVSQWEAMSLDECNFCRASASHVTDLIGDGGYLEGGDFDLAEIVAFEPNAEFEHFRIALMGNEEPSVAYSRDGEILLTTRGGAAQYYFAVLRVNDVWRIAGVSVEEGEAR